MALKLKLELASLGDIKSPCHLDPMAIPQQQRLIARR